MFCCPACLRAGRAFLAADAPTGPSAPPPPPPAGTRWIDVHCHVFNALDLPMNEFIVQTRMSNPIALPVWVLAAILVGGLQGSTPSADEEAATLDADLPPLPPPSATRDTSAALHALQAADAADIADPGRPGYAFAPPPRGGPAIVRELANSLNNTALPAGIPLSASETAAVAARLQPADDEGDDGFLPRVLGWANRFSSSRSRLIDRLVTQFGATDQVMLTPSYIDYNRWLGIHRGSMVEAAMSSLPAQLKVMAAIARRRVRDPDRPMPVFSFVPFDPWRFVEDQKNHAPDVIALAKPYIDAGSVIGFKLYPPMGFAPTGNDQLDRSWFPPDLCDLVGGHPGKALDDALEALYVYCAGNGVPIMAHAGNSNFPQHNADALLAGPEYWQPVLGRHATLRLNLGHFGGVWDFGAAARSADSDQERAANQAAQQLARRWATDIATLMAAHDGLYADVGFANTLLLQDGDTELQAAHDFLKTLLPAHPVLGKRLMYGSDWEMVGQAQFADHYAHRLVANLAALLPGDAMEDFRWRNAARFLGLGQNDATRRRISGFLRANGVPHDLLAPFDPGAALIA